MEDRRGKTLPAPGRVDPQIGNLAKKAARWKAKVRFAELVRILVDADLG